MFYQRQVLPELEKQLETDQAIVMTGMRQVGKTTLLRHLYDKTVSKNKAWFDFENPLHLTYFDVSDFDSILPGLARMGIDANNRAYIFIDEIQNLPIISRVIKYLHDHYQTKFFVTGSSSFYMKNLFPESMAGRKFIFEIFPLTFSEFLVFKGVTRIVQKEFGAKAKNKRKVENLRLLPLYKEYLEFGGLPAVVLAEVAEEKRRLLEEAFKSYFEKDVKTLADLNDRTNLRGIIPLLVPRTASAVEIGKLAGELAISRDKIYAYLEFLEETYFISLLPRFSRSFDRSAAGRKKLFFADCGLANFLGKVSEGQLLENSIFQTLRSDHQLSFYHRENSEIDFIVNGATGLEVKTTPSRRDILTLKQRSAPLKLKENYLVSLNWSGDKEVVMATDL